MMKRGRQQREQLSVSHTPRRSKRCRDRANPPLLDALRPVLSLFHSLLADADAARLLRTSRTTALALLTGYTFSGHIYQPVSLPALCHLRDLCLAYQLRITQLGLGRDFKTVDFDSAPPHLSPFPSSLTSLRLGHKGRNDLDEHNERWSTLSAAACDWQHTEPWQLPHSHPEAQAHGGEGQRWQRQREDFVIGSLDCRLPPGILPCGLRVLQLNFRFNHPLEVGSLPSSLTYLQLGACFDQPLPPGVLPASLLHLSLGSAYSQPLGAGSLPASLERLMLCGLQVPLSAVVLPPSLRALHLADLSAPLRPHVLPSSLLYFSLNLCTHPILADALPSSLIDLSLGIFAYEHPLPPGVLPSSLRDLSVAAFAYPLQPGALPEGLQFLRLRFETLLPPGALPSTLLGLDLGDEYQHPLPAGVVPHSVQWIRLGRWYEDGRIEAVLPAHTERRWHDEDDDK